MKEKYRLPIRGTVIKDEPLTGSKSDPIVVMPLDGLPGRPTVFSEELQQEVEEGFGFICLNYNLDEEWCEVELEASESFHNWLANILPQLRTIREAKGLKLDKSELAKL